MKRKAYRDSYVAAHLSNTVAAQISAMREARGWTQAELARRAGMKQPRISALEDPNCENFEAETLRRLASAFDVGLTIRFTPFSDIANWAANVTDEKLSVVAFDDDTVEAVTAIAAPRSNSTTIALLTIGRAEQAVAVPTIPPSALPLCAQAVSTLPAIK